MTARWRGETVRVVRVLGRHTLIIWRGMLKRVHSKDLEDVIDVSLIALYVLSLAVLGWLVLR